jgi:hypothetical protein
MAVVVVMMMIIDDNNDDDLYTKSIYHLQVAGYSLPS